MKFFLYEITPTTPTKTYNPPKKPTRHLLKSFSKNSNLLCLNLSFHHFR